MREGPSKCLCVVFYLQTNQFFIYLHREETSIQILFVEKDLLNQLVNIIAKSYK